MQQIYRTACYNKVFVKTITFNQSRYIRETLRGVTMQETSFPFVHFVIDDASTDGEQDVILQWMNEYCDMDSAEYADTPVSKIIIANCKCNSKCTLAVYLLNKNLFNDKSEKEKLYQPWRKNCKYEAPCEGDDYWIDPLKLQKQVDFLDSHPDYSMCFHNAYRYSEKQGKRVSSFDRSPVDTDFNTKTVIEKGGDFVPTCSMMYRLDLYSKAPSIVFSQYVGDYPLQMYMSMVGKVFYFTDIMSVYRIDNPSSWVGQNISIQDFNKRKVCHQKELKMLREFDEWSDYKYHHIFETVKNQYLLRDYWCHGHYVEAREFYNNLDKKDAEHVLQSMNMHAGSLKTLAYMYGFQKFYDVLSETKKLL